MVLKRFLTKRKSIAQQVLAESKDLNQNVRTTVPDEQIDLFNNTCQKNFIKTKTPEAFKAKSDLHSYTKFFPSTRLRRELSANNDSKIREILKKIRVL